MANAKFELKSEDVEKISKAIAGFEGDAEVAINTYLRDIGRVKMSTAIQNLIPISKVNKKHAKDSDPLKTELFNLVLTIKTKTKYNYLYFPQTGEGTSEGNGPNDFMQDGIDSIYDNIVNDMLEQIQNKIQEGL
jgi:hypothetical protein